MFINLFGTKHLKFFYLVVANKQISNLKTVEIPHPIVLTSPQAVDHQSSESSRLEISRKQEQPDWLRQRLINLQCQLSKELYNKFVQEYLNDIEMARRRLLMSANPCSSLDISSGYTGNKAQIFCALSVTM